MFNVTSKPPRQLSIVFRSAGIGFQVQPCVPLSQYAARLLRPHDPHTYNAHAIISRMPSVKSPTFEHASPRPKGQSGGGFLYTDLSRQCQSLRPRKAVHSNGSPSSAARTPRPSPRNQTLTTDPKQRRPSAALAPIA